MEEKTSTQKAISWSTTPVWAGSEYLPNFKVTEFDSVSYNKVRLYVVKDSLVDLDLVREVEKPEIYTKEHEKLLGTYENEWVLFVDGYDSNGNRIYDQVTGKTCHQCRRKTLGHRTTCSSCNLVQGQFCGDCLFMRYGENVLEANQNPSWICRGMCNCSLCRTKKGWAPTCSLYRKIAMVPPN